jgi:uncharacterized lipoprotein YehR (DUF1307 family)
MKNLLNDVTIKNKEDAKKLIEDIKINYEAIQFIDNELSREYGYDNTYGYTRIFYKNNCFYQFSCGVNWKEERPTKICIEDLAKKIILL